MLKLNTVIISYIMSFLDNKSNTMYVNTCKFLSEHGKKFGFLSSISASPSTNMMTFLKIFCDNIQTITSVTITGIDNPHIWLPDYVEKIIFNNCSILNYLNPPICKKTKILKLTDYYRYSNKLALNINWSRFPNLEEIELYVYSVNKIDKNILKKIKKININTLI